MTFRALVPVNRLDRAKGRLSDLLSGDQRRELALTTLQTVLSAVESAGGQALVLTADPDVAGAVAAPHTALAEQEALSGLNAQLEHALATLDESVVLILHADLPIVEAADIAAVLAAAPPPPSAVIAESADGGTNAMLLSPPGGFALHYGPGSADRHRSAARADRYALATVQPPGIALDLDTPADVERLMATEQGSSSAAGRLLSSFGFG